MKHNIKSLILFIFIISLIPFNSYIHAKSIDTYSSCKFQQKEMFPILKSLKQLNINQLEFTYDTPANPIKATQPCNYWIQNIDENASGKISSLGKNDIPNCQNCLTSEIVEIKSKDSSNKTFIITFKENITPNKKYKLIVFYVPSINHDTFNGRNGAITFLTK